jgi:subtilisin family serine protease
MTMVRIFTGLALLAALQGCGFEELRPRAPWAGRGTRAYTLAADTPKAPSLPGSYIVTFRGVTTGRPRGFTSYLSEYQTHFAALSARYLGDPRVKDIQFLTSINLARPEDSEWRAEFAPPRALQLAWDGVASQDDLEGSIARVDFTDETDAAAVLREWDDQGAFWFAEPNYISKLSQESDNLFKDLSIQYSSLNEWWHTRIHLSEAFLSIAQRDPATSPTDADILRDQPIVAVLDSGVDYAHPALASRIWENDPEDVNLSSCENDYHGCNTTVAKRGRLGNGDVHPYDSNGPGEPCLGNDGNCSHGTHVAGLIAGDPSAATESALGNVAGVCPVCRIMILRIVGKVGKDSGILDSSIIAAFKYVALFKRKGSPSVRIINASFGKFVRSRAVGLLVRLMRDKRQALVVAAAGNEDTMTMEYPAAFSDAIAVAAVDQDLRKETFSNFGRWVDISAPGAGLYSAIPGGGIGAKSGTSMASPVVAGVAGLMLARYPEISFDELRKRLLEGADPTLYERDWADGFNFYNYYPKLPDEDLRQPLIGLGVINADASINKVATFGLPVYYSLDRVRAGCSVITGASPTVRSLALMLLVLAAPLGLAVILRLSKRQ